MNCNPGRIHGKVQPESISFSEWVAVWVSHQMRQEYVHTLSHSSKRLIKNTNEYKMPDTKEQLKEQLKK
jgi:hypothetical protein